MCRSMSCLVALLLLTGSAQLQSQIGFTQSEQKVEFAQPHPKITIVEGATFDFGDIYQGVKAERKLTIKNEGVDTLIIDRVQAGCGCTATLLADKTVPPGKTTSLSVSFDSKSFSGTVHKDARIYSNDSTQSPLVIKFSANIIQVLTPNPSYIYFTNGKVDSQMTTEVKLKNVSKERVKILSIECDLERSEFKVKDKDLKPEAETVLTAVLTPTKLGYLSKDLVIKTSHPKQPQLSIKVFCNVTR